MKSRISALAIVTGSMLGLASIGAHASDGTITFTGALISTTCSINGIAAGTPVTSNVTLPTVSTGSLASAGATAGRSAPITLSLTGCSGTATKAAAYFENGSTVDQTSGYLVNQAAGGATNVQVRMLNSSFQPINIISGLNNDVATNGASITGGAATLQYFGEYVATGAATSGAVNATVNYTMQYQ